MKHIINKKNIFIALIFLITIAMLNLVFTDKNESGVLSAAGYTSKLVAPDTANISFVITTKSSTTQKAIQQNGQISNKVLTSIKSMLDSDEKIKTSSYTLSPYYEYNHQKKKNEQKGFKASNRIIVKLKKMEKLSKIIDTAVLNGADKVDSLNFSIEEKELICNQLLLEASSKAKQQAKMLAKNLDTKVSGVKKITSSCSSNQINRHSYAMKSFGGSMETSATQIESGEIKLNASVNIDFYLNN